MKRKNLFDLLALKEKVASNKFLHRMQPLKEEKIKVNKIYSVDGFANHNAAVKSMHK